MSGFFLAGGFFLWTLIFDGALPLDPLENHPLSRWRFWIVGSVLGALPLLPWLQELIVHPAGGHVASGIGEALQFKFWVFWITDPLGLHLGNPLGLMRGQTSFDQISDFIRYPLLFGVPTYLNAVAHLTIAVTAVWILGKALIRTIHRVTQGRWSFRKTFVGKDSDTAFAQNAALWGFGLLLTATTIMIRRYYMVVAFPFEFIFLIKLIQTYSPSRVAKRILMTLWVAELFISSQFVNYVHTNQGSTQGDYGKAYHLIQEERGEMRAR
jgi:hypothetical protein